MSETSNLLRRIDFAISDQMNVLISRRNDVWDFLGKPHSQKDIEEQLRDIRATGNTLSAIPIALNRIKRADPSHTHAVNTLLQNYALVNGYVLEIQECLIKAAEENHRNSEANKIDLVRGATFLLGAPGILVASVHNGLGNNHISPNQAAYAGAAIALPIVFKKTSKELLRRVVKAARCVAKSTVNDNLRSSPQRTTAEFPRKFGGKGPAI